MFITTAIAHVENDYDEIKKDIKELKMTRNWFNAMLHQVQTARHEISTANKLYGVQPNGKIFPAFDIHRHGLAAAYLLGKQTKENMYSKSNKGETSLIDTSAIPSITGIDERLSNLTISNRFWRPSQRPQRIRKFSGDDTIPVVKSETNKPTQTLIVRSASENRVDANIIRDKFEMENSTAENDLAAKKSIESCAEFKLLFVPGYEVDEPDEFYEDPIPHSLMNLMSGDYGEAYKKRIFALRKLEEETVANEDRQTRFDSFLNVSRYNRTYSERRGSSNSLRFQTARPVQQRPGSERTRRRISSPRNSRGTPKIVVAKTKIHNCENSFSNAKNSHTVLLSECQSLTDRPDRLDTTSSEDAESLKSNGKLDLPAPVETKPNKFDKSEVEERPRAAEIIDKEKSVKIVKKRRHKSTPTHRELRPAKFYDVTEIAATYAVPCDEKIKAAATTKKKSLAPGKSYFSQRRNSLTKNTTRRPATAVMKKKPLVNRTKRPNTALVYCQKEVAKNTKYTFDVSKR